MLWSRFELVITQARGNHQNARSTNRPTPLIAINTHTLTFMALEI